MADLCSLIADAAFNTVEGVGEHYRVAILVETSNGEYYSVNVATFWSTLNSTQVENSLLHAAQPENTHTHTPCWEWVVLRVRLERPVTAIDL